MKSHPPIDPSLRIRSATLAVADLTRSAQFYEQVLGLPLIDREQGRALLGEDAERPALELLGLGSPTPVPPRSTGLFHIAWLHPSRAALAQTVRRIAAAGWPLDGASDHGVSEALYLSDPDGLGIEIYSDRPREQWHRGDGGQGVRMITEPLDLEDLLAQAQGDPSTTIAAGTTIGHVHLKVADVARASAFYSQALGLQLQAQIPSAAFLSAGGYHHHIGLNSWQSAGGSPPQQSAPGLREVTFQLACSSATESLVRRMLDRNPPVDFTRQSDESVAVRDPDAQQLRFTAR